MAASQCAPARENIRVAVLPRSFSSITPGAIAFWGSNPQISTGRAEEGGVWVDTDYQYIFSIFNEIFDDLEDQGCLGRPWRT